MTLRGRIAWFTRASGARRRLAIEAAWELFRARLLTLRSAPVYSPALGTMIDVEPSFEYSSDDQSSAIEIGAIVSAVGNALPFRARCLQQAIALRRMLERRGIPAIIYLGVARERADRATADHAAHAWVTVGARVISGDGVLEKFAIVARFA